MSQRLDRLYSRRVDPVLNSGIVTLDEAYKSIAQTESVKYVIWAMAPIDKAYTQASYDEGDRIKNQLEKNLANPCEYEYQGSVTNDTHIKARSDIDLLAIIGKFHYLSPPQVASPPYVGDPIQDLIDLRQDTTTILREKFPEATVDASSNKAIRISGGSLRREIDVVPACWLNTVLYDQTKNKTYRAVKILDKEKKTLIPNTPFLHNHRVSEMDTIATGGLRKVARLMKSLKYDTDQIDLSSYDIVSIAFNIDWAYYAGAGVDFSRKGNELFLLEICNQFCRRLCTDEVYRESLMVPDGHRKIFAVGHATFKGIQEMAIALQGLVNDVMNENQRSFTKLSEARISY